MVLDVRHLGLHAGHLGQMFLARLREPVVDPKPPEAERVPQEGDRQEKGRDEHIPFDHDFAVSVPILLRIL